MGCGALCGDTTTADSIVNHHSRIAFQNLLQQLRENKQLISTREYSSFLQDYQKQPGHFQLLNKQRLVEGEQISQGLLRKWKLLLLGLDKNDKIYCECVDTSNDQQESPMNFSSQQDQNESSLLIFHQKFVQIEKDITRSFDVPITQSKKKEFENVLKRIANHFPKMGYTQGINFVISYLIIIGYSQKDSFEIFVHLAANRRYLFLGFYEDKFPLYYAFTVLFKNVLKRVNEVLYIHMFQTLEIDPSMLICKWFMTFYVYSFPKELIKYIWDLVILVGNVGMVTLAISLVEHLQAVILQITELSDLDMFFTSLKQLQSFNYHVNLQQLMAKAYSTELISSDFDTIEVNNHFYGEYLKHHYNFDCKNVFRAKINNTSNDETFSRVQAQQLLNNWRKTLIEERNAFRAANKTNNFYNLKLQLQSANKSLINFQHSNENLQITIEEPKAMISTSETTKFRRNSISAKSETSMHGPQKVEYFFNEINERVEEQEQSTKSKYDRKSKNSKKSNVMDELDKFELEFNENGKKLAPVNHAVRKNIAIPSKDKIGARISNFSMNQSNSLSLAGHISLKHDNSFDDVSVSSKQASNKSKIKNIQSPNVVKNSRICGCKTKTEENKASNVEQTSELEQSKDQFSDKDSVSNNNFSQNQQNVNDTRSIHGDTHRQRIANRNDYMINSHGPNQLNKSSKPFDTVEGRTETDIQVMVLQFKKNKKARVNLVSPLEILPNDKLFKIGWENEQESIESINQVDRSSQVHSHCSQVGNHCQIESIR